MPELPDLEIFKKNVFAKLTSKRLTGLSVFNMAKVIYPEKMLGDELSGRDLLRIDRIGKELFFDFGEERKLSVHLMLNGEMSIVTPVAVDSVRFKIFALYFENEALVFSDRGSLCTIKYKPIVTSIPDAFDETFTQAYFLRLASKKSRTNIKAFLIDQNNVKGIGNAYADEILWEARVSPHSITGQIPEDVLIRLYDAIRAVLQNAIESIRRISPDIISGEERRFLRVHNKSLKQTETGHPIVVERLASKITYHTDEQVIYS